MAYETLSSRGIEIAQTSMRKRVGHIWFDNYHLKDNPTGYVNMGTAENYIMTPEVAAFANRRMHIGSSTFTYGEGSWGSIRLRKAMANHMNNSFDPVDPIDPDEILFSNGITTLCELLGFTIAEPGDGIIFSRPAYQAFETDFGARAKVRCIFTAFEGVDQFSEACVEKYEMAYQEAEASGIKVRGLLLCNPHNPLGKCYSKATIIALMEFCNRHSIHLLSDEIYALSVYDVRYEKALPFTSVLAIDSSQYISKDLLHVLYGFSKDFASGGLRVGCLWTRNEAVIEAVSAISQFAWSGSMDQTLAALMLEDRAWLETFTAKSRKLLGERNRLVRGILEEKSIEYAKGANAGFFLWVDFRPWLPETDASGEKITDQWKKEEELVRRMSDKKIYFTNGALLKAEEAGWFRVIFSQEEDVILEGFKRMFEVLGI